MNKMKKMRFVFVAFFALCFCFFFTMSTTGCKKKTECEKNGHQFTQATCTLPMTCTVCQTTVGLPLGHTWKAADCEHAKTCSVCQTTEGSPYGHIWTEPTHEEPSTCTICLKTRGEVLPYAESVEISSKDFEIYMGETIQLSAQVLPLDAPQGVTWQIKTTEAADATIDENGLFTAINAGVVYVNCYSKDLNYIYSSIKVTILHELIDSETNDAFYIMTGWGSNAATDVEINYHTHNLRTSVEYTLASDVNFEHYSVATPTGYYFTNGIEEVFIPFEPRNVMRVSLTGLTPDTDYIYRINKGDNTYTETYQFKTAKNDGSKISFMGFADVHYWAKLNEDTGKYESHGSEVSEQILAKALEINPEIGFIVTAGDMVDQGGFAPCWDIFFEQSTSLKYLPRAGVSGNHEYYYNNTAQTDYKYQKAHYAGAYNGPSSHIGDSYYFVYNGLLFIVYDNEKAVDKNIQLAWLEDTLQHVEAEYTIVMMHSPVYYPASGPNAKDRDEEMMAIFEKYCVDLVIAGHYHGDDYSENYYEGTTSTDPGLGVNYITMSFGGVKSASESNRPSGYIYEIENGKFTITRINDLGQIISKRTFETKKHKEVIAESKENLIASVEGNYQEESNTYTFTFSNRFYGNVYSAQLVETLHHNIDQTMYFPTASYTSMQVTGIKPCYDYHFVLTLTFVDGSTEIIEKDLSLAPEINLQATSVSSNSITFTFDPAPSKYDFIIESYTIYINGVKQTTLNYLGSNYSPVTTYQLNGIQLEPNQDYEITFVASNGYEFMYSKTIIVSYTESI